jgi:hypothetical protein
MNMDERAEQIANDDISNESNGYAYWSDNHPSCGYGCCGGGKEIDRKMLASLILSALREAHMAGREEALDEIAERDAGENI